MRRDFKKSNDFRTANEWQVDFSASGEGGLIETGADGKRRLHSLSGHERNRLFLNDEGNFLDVSALSGLDSEADGRSFVYWDYDRDGWIDVAVINANNPLLNIYRNRIGDLHPSPKRTGNMVAIRFVGGNRSGSPTTELSCRDGIGAKVVVETGDKTLLREYRCGEGFAAQNSATMVIGIGENAVAQKITVQWPSGRSQTIENIDDGTLLIAFEDPEESQEKSGFDSSEYRRHPGDGSDVVSATSQQEKLSLATSDETVPSGVKVYMTMATWCESCIKHLPQVETLRNSFEDDELQLYGLPIDEADTQSKLLTYLDEHGPAYQLLEEITATQRIEVQGLLDDHGVEAFPSSIFVGNDGVILTIQAGIPTISDIRKWIRQQKKSAQDRVSVQID